jgi:membrane-bound metal-dependent hydrolase YbcI (DUF457 family)
MFLFPRRKETRFAVGHLALGYILGKASAKLLKTKVNVPAALVLSVIPDIDILIPFLEHRGPTHSIITALIVFIPIFAIYRQKAAPYFLALASHSLIGDYIAGGRTQLFWPATLNHYGMELPIQSPTNIALEWALFLTSTIIMLKSRDIFTFFKKKNTNLILSIPTFTVLLPTFLSFPLDVPEWLILPHLAYLAMFLASIATYALGNIKSKQ